jgi:hypothetical protein
MDSHNEQDIIHVISHVEGITYERLPERSPLTKNPSSASDLRLPSMRLRPTPIKDVE